MKKTLIASAIAAATFSGSALAQEDTSASQLAARMDSMPSVYGNIQYALAHDNFDGGPSSVEHFDNGTTLGVIHDHEVAPGITGFFKVELEGINADDKSSSNGIDGLDEAYIGVKGDSFGQIWVGSDDSTYERAVDEIAQYYEVGLINQGPDYTTGEGDLIQYMSPSFGGLSLWAAVQVNGDGVVSDDDFKDGDEKSYPYQLAALYEMDALELAFAMDSNDTSDGNNENTYGLRASYDAGNLRLTGEFHTRKDSSDTFGIIGYYSLGANQFALSYELTQFDDEYSGSNAAQLADNDSDTITLQALHNISDHMYVYFEGYLGGGDDVWEYEDEQGNSAFSDERSIASVGAVYYF
ncbi:porin [Marinobacter orientalis]|uniref:Porin n=1 Tax=Marinobacter orientalis TaxID=1928859 RepID=A0A7Y0RFJ5_9GAMM|nr:porin [Marinobacter orientalis]NMT65310.1 porin [Marinobacter orientalis]TGX47921.1 porin [Marinobacter orientalis]